MRSFRSAVLAAALLASGGALAESADKLTTVVTSPDPQTQLMAMVLTTQAVQQNVETRILLCGPAGDMGLAEPPAAVAAPQPPRGASPQGMLKALIEKGVKVEVCAIYLPGKGLKPEALLKGVAPAQPPEMAGALMEKDGKIWAF